MVYLFTPYCTSNAREIAYGFLVMQMFYNPYNASIVGIFPSSSFCPLPSALPQPRSPKVAKNPNMVQVTLFNSFNSYSCRTSEFLVFLFIPFNLVRQFMAVTNSAETDENRWQIFLLLPLLGILGLILYVIHFSLLQALAIFASGLIISISALLVGGLAGLLFGIPKTVQSKYSDIHKLDPQTDTQRADQSQTDRKFTDNTNLEEISDWLTKALVGIGLSQISKLFGKLQELSNFLKPALGNENSSSIIAISLVILFTINGFIYSYLQARVILSKLLESAEIIKERTFRNRTSS